jgi:hypothetical protein
MDFITRSLNSSDRENCIIVSSGFENKFLLNSGLIAAFSNRRESDSESLSTKYFSKLMLFNFI